MTILFIASAVTSFITDYESLKERNLAGTEDFYKKPMEI